VYILEFMQNHLSLRTKWKRFENHFIFKAQQKFTFVLYEICTIFLFV